MFPFIYSLLAFIGLLAVQSSAQTHIHCAIVVIDTSNNASYNQVHWLVGTTYLAIKASNVTGWFKKTCSETNFWYCTVHDVMHTLAYFSYNLFYLRNLIFFLSHYNLFVTLQCVHAHNWYFACFLFAIDIVVLVLQGNSMK